MVTFKGTPNMLVRLEPPVGTTRHVRFDDKGEFTTENELLIKRFHHKFDSVPAKGKETSDISDDVEYQDHGQTDKKYKCNQCDFKSDNKGELMAHKKSEHPKEGKDE
ncbi:hypothetical protein [Cohnella sp. GCM10027633]|uniref:hypothetical protein n=1 Tax=unclassified Cohnella TaxID=2636738 RepID=UPI003632E45B